MKSMQKGCLINKSSLQPPNKPATSLARVLLNEIHFIRWT